MKDVETKANEYQREYQVYIYIYTVSIFLIFIIIIINRCYIYGIIKIQTKIDKSNNDTKP